MTGVSQDPSLTFWRTLNATARDSGAGTEGCVERGLQETELRVYTPMEGFRAGSSNPDIGVRAS